MSYPYVSAGDRELMLFAARHRTRNRNDDGRINVWGKANRATLLRLQALCALGFFRVRDDWTQEIAMEPFACAFEITPEGRAYIEQTQ